LFQLRHTRSPSDNSLHLNTTSDTTPNKFTLERADSAGDAMQGEPSAQTPNRMTAIERSTNGAEAKRRVSDNGSGENGGPGRPVGMTYSCPRAALTERPGADESRTRRTSDSCEASCRGAASAVTERSRGSGSVAAADRSRGGGATGLLDGRAQRKTSAGNYSSSTESKADESRF
jgi:hypothetical protein